jgi:nucleotide-binding universal stress UspA family protein
MITLRNILVATDFGEASMTAIVYGRELARRFHATLHVLHVTDDLAARVMTGSGLPYDVSRTQADIEAAGRRQLDAIVTGDDRPEPRTKTIQVTSTAPAHAIVSYARDTNVDLIILGTHGRGPVAHLFMGSVAERVVRMAPCPVLTVRHPEHEFIRPDTLQAVTTV